MEKCNYNNHCLGMLTRENQELTKSDLKQPQRCWKINQICQTANLLDLRNYFWPWENVWVNTKFPGNLWDGFENIQTDSEFARYCGSKQKFNPKKLELFWYSMIGVKGRHMVWRRTKCYFSQSLALLSVCLLLNNQIPSVSFIQMSS